MSTFNLVRTIMTYTFSVISIIGLITNSITFVIFSRKKFKNTIFSTYFRAFLLFQCLNLIMPVNKMLEFNLNLYFSKISNLTCKLRYFYSFPNYAITAWFLVAISFDRYLSIAFPSKYQFRKSKLFQILTSLVIICYNYCFYIPCWFYYIKETRKNESNETKINLKCISPGIWANMMDLFQSILMPFLIMIFFTSLTIKTIYRSRQIVINSTGLRSKDIKFAVSSITINVLFLIFNLPNFIITLIYDYSDFFVNLNNLFIVLQSFCLFVFYINLSSTFFINLAVNSLFRKEIETILFDCKKANKSKSTTVKTTSV